MIEVLNFLGIYFLIFFTITLFGVSKYSHYGISKLLFGGLQLILLFKIVNFGEIKLGEIYNLSGFSYRLAIALVVIQVLGFFLIEDTRKGLIKSIVSCFTIFSILCCLGFNSLILFFISSQMTFYSMIGFMALEEGRNISLNSLRLFIKNEFYAGFFLLFLVFLRISTGNITLTEISVVAPEMYSISVLMFFIYFLSKLGVFPFHSNDTDIVRSGKVDTFTLGLLIVKSGIYLATVKILLTLVGHMDPVHKEYLYFVLRILGFVTIVYASLISAWGKDFFDSVSYLYSALMGCLVFTFTLENSELIQEIAVLYILITGISFSLLIPHSLKYLEKSSENVFIPKNPLPLVLILICLGSMVGVPGFPGFEIRVLLLKSLVSNGHILEFITAGSVVIAGLFFLKFYRYSSERRLNNYTVLKDTIGLQLYSATVLVILVVLSVKPTILLNSLK
ncbi:MAG: hypothetical protein KC493_05165 [Bacteriovoracaceae bacterium]|nr:hypothetical protein [Bacteriovoracaceae bacterium]